MSIDRQAAELLGDARAAANTVRQSLVNPTPATLRDSLPLLQHAADCLERLHELLRSRPGRPAADLAGPAVELQKDVRQLRALLESCAGFRAGWFRRLATQAAGYTAQGAPSPLAGAGRVLAEA